MLRRIDVLLVIGVTDGGELVHLDQLRPDTWGAENVSASGCIEWLAVVMDGNVVIRVPIQNPIVISPGMSVEMQLEPLRAYKYE